MKILTIDCEFNQPSKKTIEIGAAVYDVRSGEQLETFQTFVNPNEHITPFITELTTITDDMVSGTNVPLIKEAFLRLRELHLRHACFMNPIVWGSGVRNDSLALYEESAVQEPNFMGYRVIDAKTLYQSYMMMHNKQIKGGLKTACERLGIGFEGKNHTALADAVNTFRIWHFLTRKFQK